jgi:hypothetical protein
MTGYGIFTGIQQVLPNSLFVSANANVLKYEDLAIIFLHRLNYCDLSKSQCFKALLPLTTRGLIPGS